MLFKPNLIALVAALSPLLEVIAAPTATTTTISTINSKATFTTSFTSSRTSTLTTVVPTASSTATLLQRKEWRVMSPSEQLSYINAVKCLQTLPAATSLRGAKTLFDSFPATHLDLVDTPQGDTIHVVAQFLPWHRYFLYIHEQNLRSKCGYTGAQPYWNWSLDTTALSKSPGV